MTDILNYDEAPAMSKLRIEVEFCACGVLIFGGVPIDFITDLSKRYPLMAPGIANAMSATIALVFSKESMEEWSKDIDREAKQDHPDNVYRQWLSGSRTGLSSTHLLRLLLNKKVPDFNTATDEKAMRALASLRSTQLRGTDLPQDDADRWRCINMLKVCGFTIDDVKDIPAFAGEIEHFERLWNVKFI